MAGRMGISDREIIERLRERDGEIPERVPPHAPEGRCRYAQIYPSGTCPWCGARELERAA